jgi:hypothetical protein
LTEESEGCPEEDEVGYDVGYARQVIRYDRRIKRGVKNTY